METFFFKKSFFKIGFLGAVLLFSFLVFFGNAFAADLDDIPLDIVKTYNVEDENARGGDIVSHNSKSNIYILSRAESSKRMFGVIAESPLLVFETGKEGMPIVRSGVSKVNVLVFENKPIEQGDIITSSSFPGKGKKVGSGDSYVLGMAKENTSFEETTGEVVNYEGKNAKTAFIDVDISIGSRIGAASRIQTGGSGGFSEATVTNIVQYLIAAFIVLGSIYIAFKNFMPNLQKGVISMGRNPRVKDSIRSMVIYNSIIMILIALGGFLVGLAVIWLPI